MSKNRASLALIALLLTGCSAATTLSSPAETPHQAGTDTPAADTGTSTVPPTPWDQAPVELAKQQLGQRLGVPASEIDVESVRSVRWPDASLGCAMEPGTYERRETAGYVIVLNAGGETYDYHTDLGDRAVLCEMPVPAEAEGGIEAAVQDLTERLGIDPADITVVSVEAKTWSDSSLGCPEPGMMYMQVVSPGYLIGLQAQGRVYEYHTNETSLFVLCEDPEHRLIPDSGGAQLPGEGDKANPGGDPDLDQDGGSAPQPVNIPGDPTPVPPTCRFCMNNAWGP